MYSKGYELEISNLWEVFGVNLRKIKDSKCWKLQNTVSLAFKLSFDIHETFDFWLQ